MQQLVMLVNEMSVQRKTLDKSIGHEKKEISEQAITPDTEDNLPHTETLFSKDETYKGGGVTSKVFLRCINISYLYALPKLNHLRK